MAKRACVDGERSKELRAQAAAVRRTAEGVSDDVERGQLLDGAATLDAMARNKELASEPGYVLTLPASASINEVNDVRRRRSVRYGEDVYLPSWKDAVGLPNLLLRSALFSAVRPGAVFVEELIGVQGTSKRPVKLIMTGPQLCDYDRRLFAVCLKHYSGARPLAANDSPWVSTTFWQLSQAMQVSYNANVHKAIRSSLNRLNAVLLRIKVGGTDLPMPRLIDAAFNDEFDGIETLDENLKGSDRVAFRVHESMAVLFEPDEWSALSDDAIHKPDGLGAWLVGFYRTHTRAYDVRVKDLYEYSGSVCPMYEFRRRLKTALTKLQDDSVPTDYRVSRFELSKDWIKVNLTRWKQ